MNALSANDPIAIYLLTLKAHSDSLKHCAHDSTVTSRIRPPNMPFRAKNVYYLRISIDKVIPLYLYLDERHIDWMSDRVLQLVLEDLRPLIIPKLKAEANLIDKAGGQSNAKRGSVDVHRGDSYQFAYFFRKTEPHSVLIKTRTFVAAPKNATKEASEPEPSSEKRAKKTGRNARARPKKTANAEGKGKARIDPHESITHISSDDSDVNDIQREDHMPSPVRRSGRQTKIPAGTYREEDDENSDETRGHNTEALLEDADLLTVDNSRKTSPIHVKEEEPASQELLPSEYVRVSVDISPNAQASEPPEEPSNLMDVDLEIEEEEPKFKPVLRMQYHGFSIFGQCLCVIVEPWPPIWGASRASSVVPATPLRQSSLAPPNFNPGERARSKTPLFLPDFDRERSETPAPVPAAQRFRPPVPLFNDPPEDQGADDSDDDDEAGLMAFSQSVNMLADRSVVAEDDDELEGAVFFGDADEMREL